jgi:hypothetical protein
MPDLLGRLSKSWRHHRVASAPVTRRLFRCERCGRPLFFRNSRCLACGAEVGYEPDAAVMLTLPDDHGPPYRAPPSPPVQAGANYANAAGCNWLVAVADEAPSAHLLCRSCRLTRTLPDLSIAQNAAWWARIEEAKRQVVSTLITLGLPVRSRIAEDPERGLAFDLLRSPADGPRVITGHVDGIITIDVEEADDAIREQRRTEMHEPYRTLLGHLRHEIGHYYWYRLVGDSPLLDAFRAQFGDERGDYAAAIADHYAAGPRADWSLSYVSAYASAHPWEDWAESWAHYLHMIDALDTALSFGLGAHAIEATFEPFEIGTLGDCGAVDPNSSAAFRAFVNAWIELATALNELSRSMGQADFYPFVLSAIAVRKLHFVHRVVTARRARRARPATAAHRVGTRVAHQAH